VNWSEDARKEADISPRSREINCCGLRDAATSTAAKNVGARSTHKTSPYCSVSRLVCVGAVPASAPLRRRRRAPASSGSSTVDVLRRASDRCRPRLSGRAVVAAVSLLAGLVCGTAVWGIASVAALARGFLDARSPADVATQPQLIDPRVLVALNSDGPCRGTCRGAATGLPASLLSGARRSYTCNTPQFMQRPVHCRGVKLVVSASLACAAAPQRPLCGVLGRGRLSCGSTKRLRPATSAARLQYTHAPSSSSPTVWWRGSVTQRAVEPPVGFTAKGIGTRCSVLRSLAHASGPAASTRQHNGRASRARQCVRSDCCCTAARALSVAELGWWLA
jgi:hypothetical protein